MMTEATERLIDELVSIRLLDHVHSYEERNRVIIKAVGLALLSGFAAGFRIDPKEPEWPAAFIELPTGQVSWHIPQHVKAWDGHTTEEKYERIRRFREGYGLSND